MNLADPSLAHSLASQPLNLYRSRYFLDVDLHGKNHSSVSFVHMLVSNF
uniref:Uncharacterized protein slr0889 n=1 Tax=Rhizophora mucronata TaxID=61149 RepID=A0A2P2LT88_RHIMU